MSQLVIATPNQQIHLTLGEHILCLQQLFGMALMEEIIDSICIHSHSARSLSFQSHVSCDLNAQSYMSGLATN